MLSLLTFQLSFAQSGKLTSKHISKMITEAGAHLMKLEWDQSLDLAERILNEARKRQNNKLTTKANNIIRNKSEAFSNKKKAKNI